MTDAITMTDAGPGVMAVSADVAALAGPPDVTPADVAAERLTELEGRLESVRARRLGLELVGAGIHARMRPAAPAVE